MNSSKKFSNILLKIITVLFFVSALQFIFNQNITGEYYIDIWNIIINIIISITIIILPRYVDVIVGFIMTELVAIYYVSQSIYYRAFNNYYRFTTALSLKNEVKGQSETIKELINNNDYLLILIPLILMIILLILYRFFSNRKQFYIVKIISASILCFYGLYSYSTFKQDLDVQAAEWDIFSVYKTDRYIYQDIPSTNQFVQKFGLSGLLVRDISGTVFNNIDEDAVESITDYFETKPHHSENDYTGLFEGKSLFIIQAESLVNFAINETLTPTLYKLFKEGIVVDQFNAPLLTGSTSDTEHMANLGIIPMTDGYASCYKYVNNNYPQTLGGLFKEQDYATYGFHNNFKEYYNREIIFDKFGYPFYDSYALGLESEDLDSQFLNEIKWMLLEKDQFLAYWVTYTGHQPYYGEMREEIEENKRWIQSIYPDLAEPVLGYLAKVVDLDEALGEFLIDLENNGRLDDVVIMLFGDHLAKGLNEPHFTENIVSNLNLNEKEVGRMHETPLIFYNGTMSNGIIYDKVSSTIDLMPTIANLWGFDFNYNYIFGNDIFDPNYNGFYFNSNGDIKTDDFFYNNLDDSILFYNLIDEELAQIRINDLTNVLSLSKKLFAINYYGNAK